MQSKLEEILTEYWVSGYQQCMDRSKALNLILDEIARFINKIDPLEAKADWENSEDVAYGVKCLVVQQIQNEKIMK